MYRSPMNPHANWRNENNYHWINNIKCAVTLTNDERIDFKNDSEWSDVNKKNNTK